ncbi:hypothetical protein AB0H36_42820 [Kribbella sp. NPDC050820]|uniref:hypothetical protein n=1 Tax=Kribbella sp. NPDC050820 TaxID=3155408 RepID=UPI0034065D4B
MPVRRAPADAARRSSAGRAWRGWLTIVATFVVPGNGVAGLITALPMTAASLGTAYYAWRRA